MRSGTHPIWVSATVSYGEERPECSSAAADAPSFTILQIDDPLLELLVEQGIPGVFFTIAIMITISFVIVARKSVRSALADAQRSLDAARTIVREVAEDLQLPLGTVKSRVRLALGKMKLLVSE